MVREDLFWLDRACPEPHLTVTPAQLVGWPLHCRRPKTRTRHSPQAVETAQFARTRRICSFIRVIRQDESPRRTVQYPAFGGRRPDFGSLIASGSDPSGTSDPEFSALRPYCQRVHGQRSLLASLGQNSTGALLPSSPSLRLLRTYPDIGARTP